MIADNIRSVTQRIAKCCEKSSRPVQDVSLVCVTKEATVAEMDEAIEAGARVFGENRVQDALAKHEAIGDKVDWHLIGHLQTNKAKDAVKIFSLIHSVDSIHLAEEIDKQAARMGKVQDILIQVNTSGEASKFGIEPAQTEDLLEKIAAFPNIKVAGLMTIAPEVEDPETVRPYFRALRELRDRLSARYDLKILSMGMTNDFEIAIEEGSTMVRIGRALFHVTE
jgi:PLP dependent protein